MRLKDWKELHNLSYTDLAAKLGVQNSMTIYRYCNLNRFPKPEMVNKIETVLKWLSRLKIFKIITRKSMGKKFKIEDYRIVRIHWQDAMDCETGWHDLKKLKSAKTEPSCICWLPSCRK